VVNVDGNLTRGDCTFSLQATAYDAAEFAAVGFARLRDEVYERGANDRALRGYHAAMCMADAATFHRHAIDLVAASESGTLAGRLVALGAPHLFVAGVPGGVCEASRAQLDRLGARWIAISRSGHWPFIDQPAAFAAAVASFAREIR
jgi:pimeloyl-ACP methyl ester carboxylesterase